MAFLRVKLDAVDVFVIHSADEAGAILDIGEGVAGLLAIEVIGMQELEFRFHVESGEQTSAIE